MKKKRKQSVEAVNEQQATATSAQLGISGGNRSAFWSWRPTASDANGSAEFSLLDERAASRDLARTNPVAFGGVTRWAEYVIGRGLRLQSQIDIEELAITEEDAKKWQGKTERRFRAWSEDSRSSVEGDKNFYQQQRIAACSMKESGDIIAVIVAKERPGWPFKTAIQLIEADRVSNENNKANTAELFEGIQREVDGEIRSIWIANHHPYSNYFTKEKKWSEIKLRTSFGRQNVVHWKKMSRPGQSRGIPLPTVVTDTLKQLGRYTDAEIDGAVTAAGDALFAQMSPDSFNEIFKDPKTQEAYYNQVLDARMNAALRKSGQIVNLFPGETVTSPTPGRPNPNAGPFFQLFLEISAMGLGMPPEILIGKFTTSYTAAQASFQQWFQTVYIDRDDAIYDFCQPIYETWLFDSVSDGLIDAPGFLADPFTRMAYSRAIWTGSGRFVLNALQEAKAAELRAQFLTTEAEESMSYDGGDYETRHRQRVEEAAARRRDDLPPLGTQAQPEPPNLANDPSRSGIME